METTTLSFEQLSLTLHEIKSLPWLCFDSIYKMESICVVLMMSTGGRLYAMNIVPAGELGLWHIFHKFCFCYFVLGITRFDLLGDFGRYNWLGNFYVVFLYNMLFAGLTSASLIKTVTWAVQRELIRAFGQSTFILNLWSKVNNVCKHILFFLSVRLSCA